MKLHQAPGEIALELWPALVPFINRAAHYHPFLDQAGLKLLVSRGYTTIFVAVEGDAVMGFAAVEVVQYPSHRVANIIFAGGAYGFLGPLTSGLMDMIEAWARANECGALSLTGRPGWTRLARRHGWKCQQQVMVHKELTDERRRIESNPDS